MDKEEGYIQFLTYESYKAQYELWVRSHNIIFEKSELFYDFLYSLTTLIDKTFLGDDVINQDDDIKNHFSWCFNKVIDNFSQEKIYFNRKGIHFDFLMLFYYDAYYMSNKNEKIDIILGYFERLFNHKELKTHLEFQQFTEFYKLLEQNLKK